MDQTSSSTLYPNMDRLRDCMTRNRDNLSFSALPRSARKGMMVRAARSARGPA
jgi:hypothetical protein